MAQVSMKEIAERVGVSVTTVARALKNRPDISPETRERIMAVAEEMNYRPNILARGLVTRKSFTVGLIVTDLLNPFFPELIKGVEEEAQRHGYSVILASTSYDPAKESEVIDLFIERRVDGLIVSPTEDETTKPAFELLKEQRIPFVLTKALEWLRSDVVMADDEMGAQEAVKHLLLTGRRRIAYIGSNRALSANRERIAGYRKALVDGGVPYDPNLITDCDHRSAREVHKATVAILEQRPDAILAFSDLAAFGVKKTVQQAGLSIPDDVAIVGFDDLLMADYLDIPLSTVAIPKHRIGREAFRLLLRRMDAEQGADESLSQPDFSYEKVVLQTELKVRASS